LVFVVAAAVFVFLLFYSVSIAMAAARVVGEMRVQFIFFPLMDSEEASNIISLCKKKLLLVKKD
jgi:hypothetical protein